MLTPTGLFERKVGVADATDVILGEFAVLLAEILAQRFEPLRRVDQLHSPLTVRGLAVG